MNWMDACLASPFGLARREDADFVDMVGMSGATVLRRCKRKITKNNVDAPAEELPKKVADEYNDWRPKKPRAITQKQGVVNGN